MDYGPLDKGEQLYPKSVEAQRELHQHFNGWIDKYNTPEMTEGQPLPTPSCTVCNMSIFNHPTMLLKFDSVESKNIFAEMVDKNVLLLNEINPKAHIRPCTFAVIFWFVPCTGPFDPSLDYHLRNIEKKNNLRMNSIAAALWCK